MVAWVAWVAWMDWMARMKTKSRRYDRERDEEKIELRERTGARLPSLVPSR